jgi:hypothetical protein
MTAPLAIRARIAWIDFQLGFWRAAPDLFKLLFISLLLLAVLVFSSGCASLNPVAVAETPAQKYAAVKLTYDAVLSVAVKLVEDPTAPVEIRRGLQAATLASRDVYQAANQAYVDFVAARGELAAGVTTSDKLTIATQNLEKWSGQLDVVVGRLAALSHR